MLGYVRDGSGDYRLIAGVPGSAYLSGAFALGATAAKLVFSEERDLAFGLTESDGRPFLRPGLRGDSPQVQFFDGAPAGASDLAVSPTGSAAVFFYTGQGRALVMRDTASASPSFEWLTVPGNTDGSRSAISDDGDTILAADSGGELLAIGASQEARVVPGFAGVTAVAFLRNSPGAVVADGASQTVVLLANAGGEAGSGIALLHASDGIRDVTALATSPGNDHIYAGGKRLDGDTGVIASVETASKTVEVIDCSCGVPELQPLRQPGRFLLNGIPQVGQPLWVLEQRTGPPGLFFIPAPVAGQEGVAK